MKPHWKQMQNLQLVGYTTTRDYTVDAPAIRVHGRSAHTLWPAEDALSQCAAACTAAEDCAGFTLEEHVCYFKSAKRPKQRRAGAIFFGKRTAPTAAASVPSATLLPKLPASNRSRLHIVNDFLSGDEVSALRAFASDCFRAQRVGSPMPWFEETRVGASDCAAGKAASLLSRVEMRISRLLGLPFHSFEEPLMFTRQRAGPPREAEPLAALGARARPFTNVHHDKNKNERRHATVIACRAIAIHTALETDDHQT